MNRTALRCLLCSLWALTNGCVGTDDASDSSSNPNVALSGVDASVGNIRVGIPSPDESGSISAGIANGGMPSSAGISVGPGGGEAIGGRATNPQTGGESGTAGRPRPAEASGGARVQNDAENASDNGPNCPDTGSVCEAACAWVKCFLRFIFWWLRR